MTRGCSATFFRIRLFAWESHRQYSDLYQRYFIADGFNSVRGLASRALMLIVGHSLNIGLATLAALSIP
jgi:hypothetical protein